MKTNYHTHTNFCDGKTSARNMVTDAIAQGFDVLGFSSHAIYPYESEWHIPLKKYEEYCTCIKNLKAEYKTQIEILLGFESDFLPGISAPQKQIYKKFSPDYLIGSVHYIVNADNPSKKGFPQPKHNGKTNGCGAINVNCFAIDASLEEVSCGIKNMFDGNGKLAVQSYFYLEREMVASCDFDIIAHPDIFRKRNSVLHFVDTQEAWYKNELVATAKAIAQSGKVCEINFGGIARGTLNDTYPSLEFLEILQQQNVPITINSDAHDVGQINKGYDFAVKQAKSVGYDEVHYLSNKKWLTEPLVF